MRFLALIVRDVEVSVIVGELFEAETLAGFCDAHMNRDIDLVFLMVHVVIFGRFHRHVQYIQRAEFDIGGCLRLL